MRKGLKVFISLLVALTFMCNVGAETFDKGTSFTKSKDGKISVDGLRYSGKQYSIMSYHYTASKNGKSYTGYCLDPNMKGLKDGYVVDRLLGDSSKAPIVQAMDAGIMEILKLGFSQENQNYTFTLPNKSTATLNGDSLYAATSIALRAFTLGLTPWGGGRSTYSGGVNLASAHISLGNIWTSYYGNYYKNITKKNCGTDPGKVKSCIQNSMKSAYSWYNQNAAFEYAKSGISYNVIYGAQSLFVAGLKAANDVAVNGSQVPSIKVTLNQASKKGSTNEEYVTATIKVENLDVTSGYIKNLNVYCPDCAGKGITIGAIEVKVGNDYKQIAMADNIADYLKTKDNKKSGTITLRFLVSKTAQDDDCEDVSYELRYNYYDPTKAYKGAILKNPNNTKAQRFVIIDKLGDGDMEYDFVKGTLKCGEETCQTELETPICSTDENDAVAKVKAPSDIKKCIIDKKDDAGNSYQLTQVNNGVDNSYCKTFCKEDYAEIKLSPIKEDVVCGGYFQLTSHVQGSKDCYTGGKGSANGDKSINKEQYIKDIIEAQNKMIEARDLYLKAVAAEKASMQTEECSDCCGSATGYYKSGTYTGVSVDEEDNEGRVTKKDEEKSFSYTSSCSCSCSTSEDGTCSGGCSSGSASAVNNQIAADKEKATEDLTTWYNKYKKIISDYNSCTTGWINDYKFDQKIKYYYNEYRKADNSTYTNYYEMAEKQNKDYVYLEGKGETEISNTIEICTGSTDTSYNCIAGDKISYDGDVEDTKKDEYGYSESYKEAFLDKNFTICNTTGCVNEVRQISRASFVKKSVAKKEDYITPSVFYQVAANGRIVIKDGYKGNKLQLEKIENGLPISNRAVGGGIYKLMLENLGQFYNAKNKLGRLFDFGGKNETSSVAYALKEKGIYEYTGEYTCNYKSPCRPDDCPDCSFDCVGDNCSWKECPDCVPECINCIINEGELNLNVKTISTAKFNSVKRKYGYNWITSSNIAKLDLLNKKADKTVKEIEKINEMVYNNEKTADGSSSLAFSIKLTPEIIKEIKNYNKKEENKGGYTNDSLTCYDYTSDTGTYKNIYCYSDYLDELIKNHKDEITGIDNRLDASSDRSNNTTSSKYWQTWDGYTYDKNVIGGPSWK